MTSLPIVPASFFGIVLGLAGLGGSWRAAHSVWQLPAIIGEAIMLLAAAAWAVLVTLYVTKWLLARDVALAELHHPIQCCFVGLVGVAAMLVAMGALPYARPLAITLFVLGAGFTFGFALWRTGLLWQGERDTGTTTPVLYLPAVAGSFVAAAGVAAFGHRDWAQLFFGAGLFSWLAIESVLLHRFYTGVEMPPPLRPTLGIQLAPPAVGSVAYLGASGGTPDLFVHALLGYGLLQALLLLRLLPWIMRQPFSPSYWAFTFGATSLAAAPLRLMEQNGSGAITWLAPPLFVCANVVVAVIGVATLRLMLGKLYSQKSAFIVR